MTFKHYWKSIPRLERPMFAERVGASFSTLNQLAFGDRVISDTLALAIERETNGAVTIAELRPAFAESLRHAGYVKIEERKAA